MQAVSNDYINELNKQIIGGMTAEVDILNVKTETQPHFTLMSATNIVPESINDSSLFSIQRLHLGNIATFELNYMKANGDYRFVPPYHFLLGQSLSSTIPDLNGEFSVPTTSINIANLRLSLKSPRAPLTLYLGENTGRVRIEFTNGSSTMYTRTIKAKNGWITVDDIPEDSTISYITVTFLTLLKPLQRPHIYKIFNGTATHITQDDLIGIDYKEVNDCVSLELPRRNVTLTVNNLNGEYDQEKEYDNPSFTKHHTQLFLRVGQEIKKGFTEWISLGRYFLSDYTVNATELKFNASSAIGLLNEYSHTNCGRLEDVSAKTRFEEIASDFGNTGTAYVQFGIRGTFGATNFTSSKNACPEMTLAQGFQVLANWVGGQIIQERDNEIDFTIVNRNTESVRTLSGDLLLGKIEWGVEENINKIKVIVHSRTTGTTETTLVIDLGFQQSSGIVSTQSPIASLSGAVYTVEKRAYSAIVDSVPDFKTQFIATLYIMDSYEMGIITSNGNGETITVDNPLMSNNDGVTARAFAEKLYSELKYNVTAQFSHRGFPELDCGDVITIETQPGVFAKARVIENNLTLNQGSVSGSTKVRRLS